MKKQTKNQLLKEAVATKELKHKVVQHLKEIPIATYVCQRLGVPKATYYKWRKIDPAFLKASDEAIVSGKMHINDVAKSQLINHIKNGDHRAISFWLKHNDADFNSKLTLNIKDESYSYTKEQTDELIRAMKNAGLIGVSIQHKKLKKLFDDSKKREELLETSRQEYDDDSDFEETSEDAQERRQGVKVANFVQKLEKRNRKTNE